MRTICARLLLTAALGAMLVFPACAGLIYDDDIEIDDANTYYAEDNRFKELNSSEYTVWIYIDLEEGKAVRVDEYGDQELEEMPDNWHFAMHRWDCKTNGGEALETPYGTIAELVAAGSVPAGTFVADMWTTDKIAYDMSDMMNGNILYAGSFRNGEMSKWMTVSTSMPPDYTMSGKVYLLRMADGKMAAVQFTRFRNDKGITGYVSFDYIYPLEF